MYRINGKFISNKFGDFIEDLAKDAGRSDVQNFINENKNAISDFYENGVFERHYNENTLNNQVENFTGTIFINGEPTSNALASQMIAEFDSKVKSEIGAAGLSYHVNFGRYGREMNINLPDFDPDDFESPDELLEFLEDEGIDGYISNSNTPTN